MQRDTEAAAKSDKIDSNTKLFWYAPASPTASMTFSIEYSPKIGKSFSKPSESVSNSLVDVVSVSPGVKLNGY